MPKPWKPSRKAVEEAVDSWYSLDSDYMKGDGTIADRRDMRRALIAAAKVDGVGK